MFTKIQKIFNSKTNNFLKTSFGNILEWYDFTIYGIFAISIAKAFFAYQDKFIGLLMVFATFAIGFLARPIGSIIFGFIGDRFGKLYSVNLSIWCMAIPTALIGFLPTYSQIGIAAPILLIVLRICQGLSAGGQFSGLIAIATETNPRNKNFLVSTVYAISVIGCFAASLIGWLSVLVNNILLPDGDITKTLLWRIPFILSFVFFLIYIKLSPDFKKNHISDNDDGYSIKEIFTQMPRRVTFMVLLAAAQAAIYYLIFTYLITYFQLHLSISKSNSLFIVNVLFFTSILLFLYFGLRADKSLDRVKTVTFICLYFIVGLAIFTGGSFYKWCGIIGAVIMTIAFCSLISYTTSFFAEVFPAKYRMIACSLSFNLGVSVSGFAPMVAEMAIKINKFGLSALFMMCIVVIYISVLKIRLYLTEMHY